MAGNSQRRGAKPGPGVKKGATVGSGGQRRRGLEGRGPTPPASMRKGHVKNRQANAATKRSDSRPRRQTAPNAPEILVGRNPVVEALRSEIPATALYIAQQTDLDERVTESIKIAGDLGIAILEVSRSELERMVGGVLHQGIGLSVPAYTYSHPDDLLAVAVDSGRAPLILALDGVQDPRNLGAVVRSAAAFGAHGVLIPERRAAGITATAWRTSAGAAARLPIARATNLTRTLISYQKAGLLVAGLAADGDTSIEDLDTGEQGLCLVVGSEGKGLSRLVGETCDVTVSIPIGSRTESLNASVAASVALWEVARRR